MATTIPARVAERAATKYDEDSATGCWISTYSVASHGYAQIGWQDGPERAMTLAHRAAWTHYHGQIPDGMTVDHTCHNRRCVNPCHLRLLSNFENARRTAGRDWPLGQCIRGHSNDLLIQSGKKRRCRECRREWELRYRSKKAA